MKRKRRSMKTDMYSEFDPLTGTIRDVLNKIPYAGRSLSKLYLWKPMMFNFMLVGASGTIMSWILYEGLFRPIFENVFAGTFIGMVITTILVFLWNYTWNKKWSLNIRAQILKMSSVDRKEAHELIHRLDK